MKLNFFSFENEIDFSKNSVWRMFINNQGLFIDVVNNLNSLCCGIETDEKISLYMMDELIRWDKAVAIIVNPWDISSYEKTLQSGLYKYIDKEIIELDKLSDFQEKINEINYVINNIISEINLDIVFKNIMVVDYLKAIGLKANLAVGTPYDNIINFISAIPYFNQYRLIVLVNSDSVFKENELLEIFKQSRYNDVNILTINFHEFRNKLENESVFYIDEDFCEIIY